MRNKHLTGVALACLLGIGLMLGGGACGILFPWPGDECRTDADCPTGQVCQDGQCVAETVECTTDADCPAEQICQNGQCVAETVECTTDADCPTGQVCQNGQCVAAPIECTSDTDCDDGLFCNGAETCVEGSCQPGTDPCPVGTTCNEETDTCEGMGAPSAYETNAFIEEFDRVHELHKTVVSSCTVCHHTEPVDAGYGSCTICHPDDPNEYHSFKWVAHDQNESGDGCRSCHAAEWSDNCAFCHTALLDL